jgi:hypothetical protein
MITFWSGYFGLATSFILLATMLLWILISAKGSVYLKALLIPVAIWYGGVLFFSAQNLMGWPVSRSVPAESYILAYSIKEPQPANGYPGAIFLWAGTPQTAMVEEEGEEPGNPVTALNPKTLFDYQDKSDPRSYRLPYDRELHEMLQQASEAQQEQPGTMIRMQKNGEQGQHSSDSETSTDMLNLDIINPLDLLPKKDQGISF